MRISSLILTYVFFAGMFLFIYRQAKSGRITERRLLLNSVASFVVTPVALGLFLFVVAARVPGAAKDGLFGLSGGLIVGVFFLNLFLAAVNLGKHSGRN